MAVKKERKIRVSRVPENETKEQKFIRLATARVNKVRKALDQIGLLGGASYVSTDLQREKIVEAIRESVEFNTNRLSKVKMSKNSFTL
jgi:ABC-type oligopeptide transport system substrate-binding subunit